MAYPYRQPYGPRDAQYPNTTLGDSRGGLMRRFTTNALPTLGPVVRQQRRPVVGDNQMAGLQNRIAPSERRIRHIERLLEQQRQINAELEKIDDETRKEVEDGLRHERAVSDMIAQSEPTTPPEYQDSLRNVTTRSNRFSNTSLTSPPSITGRPNRSSTQLTSPVPAGVRPYSSTTASTIPSQSVPGSRRHSDDEEDDDVVYFDTGIHRSAATLNRNSMPVPSYDRKRNVADLRSSLDALDHSSFFTDSDEPSSTLPTKSTNTTSSPDIKTYLQVQHTADGFPKLIRREDNGELVSGFSAALDLAYSHASNGEQQLTDRATATRHRVSLPPTALSSNGAIAPLNSILANSNDIKSAAASRRSLEVKFSTETKRPPLMASPPHNIANGMGKGPSSYSTNDLPTLKSIEGEHSGGVSINSPPSTQASTSADTSTQNRNSLNLEHRVSEPVAKNTQRQSQEFKNIAGLHQNHDVFTSPQVGLQGTTASFGPPQFQDTNAVPSFPSPNMPYGQSPFYGGYGMQSLNNGFNNMNIGSGYGSHGPWPNQMQPFQPVGYGGFQQYPQAGQAVPGAGAGNSRYSDGSRAALQQRKAQADELYANITIPGVAGQIYGLCKDQHGCRFLQKKLEEQNEQDVQIIFDEVKDHFHELMVDPFGNYLCQRLLEHCNTEQRTVLVENAVPTMTTIALNQHGTRALQRMIEAISTPEQTTMLIKALRYDVVQLIQDLNGNHVIQKCLNHLSSQDAQFIFDAVAANCVVVGTHRHGCCVVQRCVDHATGMQKGAMVDSVIANAYALVQDPFGNYVVQYILDLSEPCFTEPLCLSFAGSIAFLSKQKFSSNVIEKCIRCAGPDTRRVLIREISSPQDLERLLRDSFANYVVQTAMEFADDELKTLIVENLRPMLPAIRNTPHGRRIQSKIQDYDNGGTGAISNANAKSSDSPNGGQTQVSPGGGRANRMGMVGVPPQWAQGAFFNGTAVPGTFGNGDIASPAPQRNQAYNVLNVSQNYLNSANNNPNPGNPGNLNNAYNGQGFGRQPPHYGHF